MNRIAAIVATPLLFLLVWPAGQARAAGFGVNEYSAMSTGMSHATIARLNEPGVLFTNPAGLVLLPGLQISGGAALILAKASYEDPQGVNPGESSSVVKPIPSLAVSWKINDWVAVGVGLNAPYGLAIDWPDGFAGEDVTSKADLQVPHITLGASVKLADGLYLGISGQVAPTSVLLERRVGVVDDNGNAARMKVALGGTGTGFGGTIGILYRPIPSLFLGASYKTHMLIDIKGDAHFGFPDGSTDHAFFKDQPGNTRIATPDEIKLGVGFKPNPCWYVEADVALSLWNAQDAITLDFPEDTSGQLTQVIPQNWDKSWFFKVGAEWQAVPFLAFRFGGGFETNPIPDSTLSPQLPDGDRVVASAGLTYAFTSLPLAIDAAYILVKFLGRTVDNDVFDATYNTTAHILNLNVRYTWSPATVEPGY